MAVRLASSACEPNARAARHSRHGVHAVRPPPGAPGAPRRRPPLAKVMVAPLKQFVGHRGRGALHGAPIPMGTPVNDPRVRPPRACCSRRSLLGPWCISRQRNAPAGEAARPAVVKLAVRSSAVGSYCGDEWAPGRGSGCTIHRPQCTLPSLPRPLRACSSESLQLEGDRVSPPRSGSARRLARRQSSAPACPTRVGSLGGPPALCTVGSVLGA